MTRRTRRKTMTILKDSLIVDVYDDASNMISGTFDVEITTNEGLHGSVKLVETIADLNNENRKIIYEEIVKCKETITIVTIPLICSLDYDTRIGVAIYHGICKLSSSSVHASKISGGFVLESIDERHRRLYN